MSKGRLRAFWLQVHKWIGLALAVLIIPISLSGALLVWDEGLDRLVNPGRFAVSGETVLPPSRYAEAAARAAQPGERLASLRITGEGPVVAALIAPGQGEAPPRRRNLYLDPPTAGLLDAAGANDGALRFLHVLHGSLLTPGVGRQIVGWVGVFMFISCLTGLWLWWPVTGSIGRGFRWRRQPSTNANIHHLLGFWILLPLAMLSFTGAWISFPQTVAALTGAPAGGGEGAERARRARALPLERSRIDVDFALGLALPAATGELRGITWPTDQDPRWSFAFARDGGAADVRVSEADFQLTPASPPAPETTNRLMRRWHDGTDMGWLWQMLIFLGGIIPCVLAVTGILMWWRSRQWRRRAKAKGTSAA